MTISTNCVSNLTVTEVTEDGFAHPIGRKLRSFDMDGTMPCEHPGVIAFLKAFKLTDLTSDQIRVLLLLRDNPDPQGYTAADVARWLPMPVATGALLPQRTQAQGVCPPQQHRAGG